MPFVVKAAPPDVAETKSLSFHEKTMYRGKNICPRDDIFVFASDHQGGQGLVAKGIVTSFAHGPGIRVSIKVRRTAVARRNLGRPELKPFCDRDDDRPQTEIARKLYRQATDRSTGPTRNPRIHLTRILMFNGATSNEGILSPQPTNQGLAAMRALSFCGL